MDKLSILVIEDTPLARTVMARQLTSHSVTFAEDFASARRRLDDGAFDLCFIDLNLGKDDDCSGLKLIPIAAAKGIYPVVVSSCDNQEVVDKAYELGCQDFYVKGNEQANVAAVLDKYFKSRTGFNADLFFSRQFVTDDPATRASVAEAVKYAATDLPILILGPSGTGKTCLGRLIHEHSGRQGEFVALNCAAYPEDLLEAELFGSRRGAFTGASENRKGRLLQAHKGTLFLDEIGAMSLNMQAKLLKAIEECSFYPVGSDKPESSEFRIISATLEDPQQLNAQGRLRFDFFQRIHGLTVLLKPLCRRRGDVLPLIQFFTQGGKRLSFSQEAKALLLGHSWPGNTRELRKVVELLSADAGGRMSAEQVRKRLTQALDGPPSTGGFVDERQYRYALEHGLDKAVDRFTSEIILRNLGENQGKKTRAMAALKICSRLLYSTLKKQEAADGKLG
jgi:DNA-binding NtrC family response regulator